MTKPTRCDHCHDTGIVELKGTARDGYSRGSAPCRWCPEGERLRNRLEEERQHPLTDYSIHSLAATPQPGYHPVTREEALADWQSCTHNYQPIAEPQHRPWAKDIIHLHQCARCGKQEVRTINPPEPAEPTAEPTAEPDAEPATRPPAELTTTENPW